MSSKKIKKKKSPLWDKNEQIIANLVKSGIQDDKLLEEATRALGIKKSKKALEGFLKKLQIMSGDKHVVKLG